MYDQPSDLKLGDRVRVTNDINIITKHIPRGTIMTVEALGRYGPTLRDDRGNMLFDCHPKLVGLEKVDEISSGSSD